MAPHIKAVLPIFLAVTAVLICAAAQTPEKAPTGSPAPQSAPVQRFPSPTNLRVLPTSLTGLQVNSIMEQWDAYLGVRCDACHAYDGDKTNPDGTPKLNFADDSKEMKAVTRRMITMTDQINTNFIAKLEGSGLPVTCGTCHRARISPEPFAAPDARPVLNSASSPGNEQSQTN